MLKKCKKVLPRGLDYDILILSRRTNVRQDKKGVENMKKRLRLKREWCFVLGVVATMMFTSIANVAIDYYSDYLQRCDAERGYTCNIFGK